MALRSLRIICATEEEVASAFQILGNYAPPERQGYYVFGTADEKEVPTLEALGVTVEVMPDEATICWLEPSTIPMRAALMAFAAQPDDSPLAEFGRQSEERYVIQFTGQLRDADRAQLQNLGVQLGSYVPDFAFKAALNAQQKEAVELLGFVRRVVHYSPEHTLRRLREPVRPETAVAMNDQPEEAIYDLKCHDPQDLQPLQEALEKDGRVERVELGRFRLRFWTTAVQAEGLQRDLALLPQVSVIERFTYPTPQLDALRVTLGVEAPAPAAALPWDGTGQTVSVADSGVDTHHPDLLNRLLHVVERVPPEAPDDPDGHGTHVCGVICGDGSASAGKIRGISPGAKIFVQSIRDREGRFSGLPVDLGQLFQEAYDAGARIHNDSWGVNLAGLYTADSFEIDHFIYEHPDFLVVLAAGNAGQQPNPPDPSDPIGRIGFNSLASPAAAKNVLTVGACCSARPDGPYAGKSWKDYQGRLPAPQVAPIANEPINGDADILAAFSSRGPSDDERIKPDLVAPGTVILSTRSGPSTPMFPFAGFNNQYTFMSGTSMATPAVTGAAAITRQYFVEQCGVAAPSAALLKAALINGCVWIPRNTANDDRIGQPNFHQGFGRLDLAIALPRPGSTSNQQLVFADVSKSAPEALNSNTPAISTWKKRLQVDGSLPLRVTLVWTDYPAHGLQQHLDLMLISPEGQRTFGNPHLQRGPWAKTDRFNNVQRIVVDTPVGGVWTLVVMAANTPFDNQGFSLVATGALTSALF